jgi:hypothetical protein
MDNLVARRPGFFLLLLLSHLSTAFMAWENLIFLLLFGLMMKRASVANWMLNDIDCLLAYNGY